MTKLSTNVGVDSILNTAWMRPAMSDSHSE
jgi:hypothetical protein